MRLKYTIVFTDNIPIRRKILISVSRKAIIYDYFSLKIRVNKAII